MFWLELYFICAFLIKKLLMKAFFRAQFSYYPLVWMWHSRSMDNKINRLRDKCLSIIYNDKMSFFATEMFKVHTNMSTELIQEFFR